MALGATIATISNTFIYSGSIIAVDREHIEKVLKVSPNVFNRNGLVSNQVACQMALEGLYSLDLDVCIAVVGNIKPPLKEGNNSAIICMAVMTNKRWDEHLLNEKYSFISKNIQKTEQLLNVSKSTLQRWDNSGKLIALRTEGGHRRINNLTLDVY